MSIATEISRLQTAKSDLKTAINSKLPTGLIANETIDDYADFVDNISPEIEYLAGFPELDTLAVNNIGLIITTINPIYTFAPTGTSLTVTVTGGGTGTYLLNGSSANLGQSYSIDSETDCRIEVSTNGKITDYNTANGFTAFKVVVSGTEITDFVTKINVGDKYITNTSIIYAHINYSGALTANWCRTTSSTSDNVGVASNILIKVKLSNITVIGNYAFQGIGITDINLPNTVTSIAASAFQSCNRLKSITLSSNLTSIGDGAFVGCSSLIEITIINTATNIYSTAFSSCYYLKSINNSSNISATRSTAQAMTGLYNLEEWNFDNTRYTHSLSLSAGSATASQAVKGKLNKVKFKSNSTFGTSTTPQLRIANQAMSKAAIEDVLTQIIATGVTGKTVSFLGCTGVSDFTTEEKSDWATATGWTITWE